MRRRNIPAVVLVAALCACVVEPELLNSERIESRYGNFGIEVVSQTDGVRRSRLYSSANGARTCRTYAIARIVSEPPPDIDAEHRQITAGASIGATFKANGWRVFKETRLVDSIVLAEDPHGIYPSMGLDESTPLAVHVYRLLLNKDGQVIDYATIIELHHPDYLREDEVRRLFEVDDTGGPSPSERRDWISLINDPVEGM